MKPYGGFQTRATLIRSSIDVTCQGSTGSQRNNYFENVNYQHYHSFPTKSNMVTHTSHSNWSAEWFSQPFSGHRWGYCGSPVNDFIKVKIDSGNSPLGSWRPRHVANNIPMANPMPLGLFGTAHYANKATNDAIADIKNLKIHALTTMGEAAKTSNYIQGKLIRLYRGLVYLKKGNWRAFKRNFLQRKDVKGKSWDRSIAARWLEYNYAITPLVFDVTNAIDTLSRSPKPFQFVTVGRSKETWVTPTVTSTTNITHSGTTYYRTTLVYEIVNPFTYSLSSVGLSYNDALVTAWELVPFSFVADWALNLGDYLSLLNYEKGLRFVTGSKTIKTEQTYTYKYAWNQGKGNGTIAVSHGFRSTFAAYQRTRLTAGPAPHWMPKVPILNAKKASVLISLAAVLRPR